MPQDIVTFWPSFAGATMIVLVHLFVHRMAFLHGSRSLWLDVFAGVALGYLFVDILPHLASYQHKFTEATDGGLLGFLEHHAYLVTMAGFLIYLAIALSGNRIRAKHAPGAISLGNLPLTVGIAALSMVVYAFLIGYMLAEQPTHRSVAGIGFGFAMAAHFIGLDHFYRDLQPRLFDTPLRYALAGAIYGGWLLGIVGELPDLVYALLFALLAGGLMVVTAVFELPRVNSARRYAGFCLGAIGFSALILVVEHVSH
jgi:hypothetical protein